MRPILAMPITWKVKSDADYVALVRRQLRMAKSLQWFALVLAVLCFVAGLGFPMIIYKLLGTGHLNPFSEGEFAVGFAAGFGFFALSGFCVVLGVAHLGLAMSLFKGSRTEKLLIKYYDRCNGECQHPPA